jgi:hypothetical protein
MRFLGILLVLAGVILLIYGGFTLFIPQNVFNLGDVQIAIRENLVIPLSPTLGLVLLVIGLIMIVSAPVYPPAPPPY